MVENSTYASSTITATWRGTLGRELVDRLDRAAPWPWGLLGLQTSTMRGGGRDLARHRVEGRGGPPASTGTVTARAPVIADRCGYIENEGHAYTSYGARFEHRLRRAASRMSQEPLPSRDAGHRHAGAGRRFRWRSCDPVGSGG